METPTYRSRASRYFCFLISKKIFIEYRLSSTLVKPERYFSTSSHSPSKAFSSKYFKLKKYPDSCSSLHNKNKHPQTKTQKIKYPNTKSSEKLTLKAKFREKKILESKIKHENRTYLWTDSLNFSSSKNWRIKKTNSLLRDDISSILQAEIRESENLGDLCSRERRLRWFPQIGGSWL